MNALRRAWRWLTRLYEALANTCPIHPVRYWHVGSVDSNGVSSSVSGVSGAVSLEWEKAEDQPEAFYPADDYDVTVTNPFSGQRATIHYRKKPRTPIILDGPIAEMPNERHQWMGWHGDRPRYACGGPVKPGTHYIV